MDHRPALKICIAILLILAIAAGLYYYWHSSRSRGRSFLPAPGAPAPILSLLPQEAPYVIYANVAALRDSAFLTRLTSIIPAPAEDPEYTDFVRQTGFDYTRDLDRVSAAIFPTSPTPLVLIFAEGRFDRQKITEYAMKTGTAQQRDGKTVYVMPASTPGNTVSLEFLAPSRIRLVSGPANLDVPPATGKQDANITDRVQQLGGADLFAIVRTDSIPANLTIGSIRLDELASTLKGVRWITLFAAPESDNLRATLEGDCDSTAVALQLEFALSGFRLMGRAALSDPSTRKQLTPQGAAALDQLVRQIQISHDGGKVSLSAAFTPEMLTGLAAPPLQKHPAPGRAH